MSKRPRDNIIDISEDIEQDDGSSEAKRARESADDTRISCFTACKFYSQAVIDIFVPHGGNMLGYQIQRDIFQENLPPVIRALAEMVAQTEADDIKMLLRRITTAVLSGNEPARDDVITLLVDSKFTYDTILVLGEDGNQEYLLAHRDVLVASCTYFSAMLGNDSVWPEARAGKKPFIVRKPNASKQVFYHVMQYLYCGRFHNIRKKSLLLPMFVLADELGLLSLQKLTFAAILENFLTEQSAIEVVKTIIGRGTKIQDHELMPWVASYALRPAVLGFEPNAAPESFSAANLNGMMQLSQDHLEWLLQKAVLLDQSVTEPTLLSAVVEWALRSCGIPSCSIQGLAQLNDNQKASMRDVLIPILQFFDFSKLGTFQEVVTSLALLDTPVHARWVSAMLTTSATLTSNNQLCFGFDEETSCCRARTITMNAKLPGFNGQFSDQLSTNVSLGGPFIHNFRFSGLEWELMIRQTPVGWKLIVSLTDECFDTTPPELFPIHLVCDVWLLDKRVPWHSHCATRLNIDVDEQQDGFYCLLVDDGIAATSSLVSAEGEVTLAIAFRRQKFKHMLPAQSQQQTMVIISTLQVIGVGMNRLQDRECIFFVSNCRSFA